MNAHLPIAVFDSGIGGLSVLRAIRKQLPNESLLYFADTAFAPWGERSPDWIADRSQAIAAHLVERGAKALVIACNTATAAAAERLRQSFDLPIVAMEPGVKPAVTHSRSGVVGIMATRATLASPRYASLLERYAGNARVVEQACPGLVECVESGDIDSEHTLTLLGRYLKPLLQAGADHIVLGCTHYPLLAGAIEGLLDGRARLIDTGPAVAAELQRRLAQGERLAPQTTPGQTRFLSSGSVEQLQRQLRRYWPQPVGADRLRAESL